MVKDDTKQRIEAMSIEEMAHEVNRGHRSRFQRDNFAYLKTCYEARLRKIDAVKNAAPNPSTNQPNNIHHWYQKPLGQIFIGIVIVVLGTIAVFLIIQHTGIPLNG